MTSKSKRKRHVFFDDHGYPDPRFDWEEVLPISGSSVLRKRLHPAPPLDSIDPAFNTTYNEAIHGEKLQSQLQLSHLPQAQQLCVLALVKKYWAVFDDKGVSVPVLDYECHIDTGSHPPISCRKVTYGPLESPKIQKAIDQLLDLHQIHQVFDGAWLSKGLLAPKPHQESVTDIDNFVWRFCVNYIPLNSVTRVVAYPVPRCDDAVQTCFGGSKFKWLMDAPSGYHQIRVAASSQPKLAFAGPDGSKYTYLVMPFGPVNGPVIFIIFIHDMNTTWKEVARSRGIVLNASCNTRIIIDDIFSWAPTFEIAMQYLECQL